MVWKPTVYLVLAASLLLPGITIAAEETQVDIADLPERAGERPQTSDAPDGTLIAHEQITDLAPAELQEQLYERAAGLPHVATGPSHVSVPGARAFHLSPDVEAANVEAFMVQREFAHLHPPRDGSLHMSLPAQVAAEVLEKGWGERHPRNPRVLMVYGPRTETELEIVWRILLASYLNVLTRPEGPNAASPDPAAKQLPRTGP